MFLQKLSRFFIIFFSLQRFMTVFLRKIFCSPVMFTIKKLFLLLCLISSFNLIMIFQNFSTLSADGIKLLFFVKVFSDSYYPCGFFFFKASRISHFEKPVLCVPDGLQSCLCGADLGIAWSPGDDPQRPIYKTLEY